MSEWHEEIEFKSCIKNPNYICVDPEHGNNLCPCSLYEEEKTNEPIN